MNMNLPPALTPLRAAPSRVLQRRTLPAECWPSVCTALALLLLLIALRTRSEDLTKVAVTVLGSTLGLMTYFTGEPPEEVVKKLSDISQTLIERHEDFAWAAGRAVSPDRSPPPAPSWCSPPSC